MPGHLDLGNKRIGEHGSSLAYVGAGHGRLAATTGPASTGGGQSSDGSLSDQAVLELGKGTEDVKHQPATGARSVNCFGH